MALYRRSRKVIVAGWIVLTLIGAYLSFTHETTSVFMLLVNTATAASALVMLCYLAAVWLSTLNVKRARRRYRRPIGERLIWGCRRRRGEVIR